MTQRLTDIAVFIQVVKSGSFTAAARQLGMAKSVVSKHVTRLEDQLGVRLLHRTTRRLSLTEAGERLHEGGARALQDIEEVEREVSVHQLKPHGRLRVAAPMSFGLLHLAPLLPEFLREHPLINIDLRLDDRPEEVIAEGIDIALRIAPLRDSSFVARRLTAIRHVTVATPAYLRAHGRPQHPSELGQHACLTFSVRAQPNIWHYRDAQGREFEVTVDGPLRANNSLVLREALLAGLGIAHTPSFVVGAEMRSGRLVPILTDYSTVERDLSAVLPERHHIAPKTRVFLDFITQRLRDPAPWDTVLATPARRTHRARS